VSIKRNESEDESVIKVWHVLNEHTRSRPTNISQEWFFGYYLVQLGIATAETQKPM